MTSARIGPALMRHYGMSAEQVVFFPAHEQIGEQVTPIDALLLARYDTAEDRRHITRAVRLSHEFELLFYDTVLAAPTGISDKFCQILKEVLPLSALAIQLNYPKTKEKFCRDSQN